MALVQEQDLRLAQMVAKKLRERLGGELQRIVLFGSRAKGTPKPNSDYDFFLVLPRRDSDTIDDIYGVVADFEQELEIDVSLKIYSQRQYHHMVAMNTPFARAVAETGIPL